MGLMNWAQWARGVGLNKLGEMGWARQNGWTRGVGLDVMCETSWVRQVQLNGIGATGWARVIQQDDPSQRGGDGQQGIKVAKGLRQQV